mmetsp:Transcript_10625/g.19270  ORF Transcript_10625/g.19270 Transcript_10625/m.19270 type:complete len:202 (+) Transcript_10625:237-842(+)
MCLPRKDENENGLQLCLQSCLPLRWDLLRLPRLQHHNIHTMWTIVVANAVAGCFSSGLLVFLRWQALLLVLYLHLYGMNRTPQPFLSLHPIRITCNQGNRHCHLPNLLSQVLRHLFRHWNQRPCHLRRFHRRRHLLWNQQSHRLPPQYFLLLLQHQLQKRPLPLLQFQRHPCLQLHRRQSYQHLSQPLFRRSHPSLYQVTC